MVQIPVQGIHLGRLGLRLGSGVQTPNLPAALEPRFLVCPSFCSCFSSREHRTGTRKKLCFKFSAFFHLSTCSLMAFSTEALSLSFVNLGMLQAARSERRPGWHVPLTDGGADMSNIAHLPTSRTVHFSQQVSPLPPLYALPSFHCPQFCSAAAVAPLEIH